jgi:iron complex transport system permease protein
MTSTRHALTRSSRVARDAGRAERGPSTRWVAIFLGLFVAAALALPFIGPFALSLPRLWARQQPDWSIFVQLRISRTLLGLFAGGALSLAGALFQAMLRDALATPYTLGISAGASLGAVVAIWMDWQQVAGMPAIWVAALAGAALVLALVVGAALQQRRMSSFSLLLSGLAANSVCSAFIIVIYSVVGSTKTFSIARWLIGSLDSADYPTLAIFMAVVTLAAIVVMRQAKAWNLMAVDPAWAATRGARVTQLTLAGYGAGSVLTAVTVALTGPIGFVGLVVPHLVRTRIGADHRVLMPCAFLGGGVLLATCDAIGRIVMAPSEVPAGAVMAILGGPYLVWVLRQRSTV